MATEEAEGFSDHFRSVTVTAIAALAGVIAALISSVITGEVSSLDAAQQAAKNQNAQLVVLGAILIQPLLLRVLGLLKDDFGLKDFLYIAFMTFSLWFVTWGVLLTTSI
jgi:hypothetical protein